MVATEKKTKNYSGGICLQIIKMKIIGKGYDTICSPEDNISANSYKNKES
jgi:hypothetical protein